MGSVESVEVYTNEVRRRYTRSFLDLLILQLVQTEPAWGYKIIQKTQDLYGVELRHSALYPMLGMLEAKGLLQSQKQLQKRRVRKVYHITQNGRRLLQAYHNFLKEMIQKQSAEDKEDKNEKERGY